MIKRIYTFALLAIISLGAMAQGNAKAVLDKTASVVKGAGDIKVDFSGSMTGSICVRKNKLYMQSSTYDAWYDGKTLWSLNKKANEVNISTPSALEQQRVNPLYFINIYKQGYTYTMRDVSVKGKSCYEVTLNATSASNKIKKMVIAIDKSNYYPVSITMVKGKNTSTINIVSCKTKQKFAESLFTFNKAAHPGVEIIDLR